MGYFLSKFRRGTTVSDLLERIEQEIKDIEEYSISTRARQKRYVGNFLIFSIGFYILYFIAFYFVFLPPTWKEILLYSLPLLIFPILILVSKHIVAWFFQRRINRNSIKLAKLKNEKKKLLDEVMETETYKVANEILKKYGEKTNNFNMPPKTVTKDDNNKGPKIVAQAFTPQQTEQQKLFQRRLPQSPQSDLTQQQQQQRRDLPLPTTPLNSFSKNDNWRTPMLKPRPFPIISSQNKGVFEKLVDYLIGDGPQNRFAMICKECLSHNGMASQDEYEYAAFRCVFCNAMNSSRKARPVAPKLPSTSNSNLTFSTGDFSMNSRNKIKDSDSSSSSSNASSKRNSESESDNADLEILLKQSECKKEEEEKDEEKKEL